MIGVYGGQAESVFDLSRRERHRGRMSSALRDRARSPFARRPGDDVHFHRGPHGRPDPCFDRRCAMPLAAPRWVAVALTLAGLAIFTFALAIERHTTRPQGATACPT